MLNKELTPFTIMVLVLLAISCFVIYETTRLRCEQCYTWVGPDERKVGFIWRGFDLNITECTPCEQAKSKEALAEAK